MTDRQTATDPAMARMAQIVGAMTEMMNLGNMPAVDLADMRVLLGDGGIAYSGVGEAAGPERARLAVERAVKDLMRQIPSIDPERGGG